MKKGGITHPELSFLVASVGHTDYIVLADQGYPIPDDVMRINLGFMDDHPTVPDVLTALALEMDIDRLIVTEEMASVSPQRLRILQSKYPDLRIEKISHTEFKQLTNGAKGAVKTADTCPYANLIVVSG